MLGNTYLHPNVKIAAPAIAKPRQALAVQAQQ